MKGTKPQESQTLRKYRGEEIETIRIQYLIRRSREKIHDNEDTRRWGYFPALDPLLSFSEFMDEFLKMVTVL